eukprot:gnl/MRDRNA2_/MRDRNA2_60536_c0_seq1.p1 gnl/MRDRNA2_/MRDRNA2_60536_c0~~gnl/MRDRNA2_/MRDRNA2_60536_c0_seq1.p1  ORF type:complete len:420 (-),score=110.35 gnl/MRDRNA2_/MRDRNA2_60536_c0_seq1:43-1302(-)
MMSCTVLVSLLAMASAENLFPFVSSGVDSMSSIRSPLDAAVDRCEPEQNFFEKGVGMALIQNEEFDSTNVKIALGRNKKYIQVDQPFSHAANALSLSQVDVPEEEDDETKASKLRAKIRSLHAWSATRITQAEETRKLELKAEIADLQKLKSQNKDVKIDVYYVNMDKQKERKNCLERQFKDMPGKPQPIRYPAIKFPEHCSKAKTHALYEQCLHEAELGDCFEAGIDYAATGTHGSQNRDEHKIRSAVISNWCGHKRLFQKIEDDAKNNTDHAKYVVMLEDDVILDRKYFMTVLQDFATKYENRDWDFVQIDPFGHKDKKDLLEHFRGKPVFKPASDGQCSAYWGFHAVLIKVSALHRINHWMKLNQAIPIDWLPWRMPHGLSYSALVSRNPEAALNGNVIVLPSYCSSKVMKSTIGA